MTSYFFAADDPTKELLVSAGADPGSIYTRAELDVLVRRRTTVRELQLIHAAKKRFNGKVTNPWLPSGIPSRSPKPEPCAAAKCHPLSFSALALRFFEHAGEANFSRARQSGMQLRILPCVG